MRASKIKEAKLADLNKEERSLLTFFEAAAADQQGCLNTLQTTEILCQTKKKECPGTKEMEAIVKKHRVIKHHALQLGAMIQSEFPLESIIWLFPQHASQQFKEYTIVLHGYDGDLKIENSQGKQRWLRGENVPFHIVNGDLKKPPKPTSEG